MGQAQRRSKELVQVNESTAAYVAGLVDGEGSFFEEPANSGSWRFQIQMTHSPTIRWFSDTLGTDSTVQHRKSKNEKHKDLYRVSLGRHQTLDLIKMTMPYLITKRELAEKILESATKSVS